MSKARKRHHQPWWKRKFSNRKKRKLYKRRLKRGEIRFTTFDAKLREVYPDTIEAPTYAGKYPWS